MNIYISRAGKQLGPYTLEDARRQRDAGAIQDSDYAWHEGLPEWVSLAQIAGFNAPTVGGPVAHPPLPYGAGTRGVAPTGIRIVTAFGIFVVLFIAVFVLAAFISLIIGGAISGAHAAAAQHAQGFDQGQVLGREAGRKFGQTYGPIIAGWSALFSLVVSISVAGMISFSNLLPWCRRR